MTTLLKHILHTCILVGAFFSCKVEKRIYRKGYHVVWNHHKSNDQKQNNNTEVSATKIEAPEVVVVSASTNTFQNTDIKAGSTIVIGKDTCGDVIYLKNGEKIKVKVLEVAHDIIKYKRCDNLDGPLFTVRKSSLAMLQYYNGIKEDLTFEASTTLEQGQTRPTPAKKQNGMGLAAFISAIAIFLSAGLTLPFAMIFGIISMGQFKREPDKYTDKWMPRVALIICAVLFFLAALICLLVASSGYTPGLWIAVAILAVLGLICVIPLTSPQ